ncbi:MAG: AAA-like domain-containing protein, partial [Chloroflexota bacterium]
MMTRYFNTAGPVDSEIDYCLPPLTRVDLDEILHLIRQRKYFVLHAPRQTGKTSLLLALQEHINREGRYHCVYVNVEVGQTAREDVPTVMHAILDQLALRAETEVDDPYLRELLNKYLHTKNGHSFLNQLLTLWSQHWMKQGKPIVLFIDEIDSLIGDSLLAVLRQLRAGYDKRPKLFPQSIILCGVRDIRDYRIHASSEKVPVAGGSAFNVKVESLRLGDFTKGEMTELIQQHTDETGQPFSDDAINQIWSLSSGQPWLVNALGYEVTYRMKENRDHSTTITADMINRAKENLILRRDTHIDQLIHKLEESRVQRVIEPLLTSEADPESLSHDDIQYVRDLGLIKGTGKKIAIANPIYQEVIPRELTYTTQLRINHETE